jgi:hypothetical protein
MNGSQWQISRGFVMVLVGLFLFWLIVEQLFPAGNLRTKAMIIKTRSEERWMAALLTEQAIRIGGLTNINQQFVLESFFAGNQNQIRLHTNAAGEVVDVWRTPYRIKLIGPTNFSIRSASRNRNFGDADDIVFNSASNNFVKP